MKGSRLRTRRRAITDAEKEQELITRTLNAKKLQFFTARTLSDFPARCAQAASDFMVTKEQTLNSKDWRVRTNITISRKVKSRFGVFQLNDALPKFYGGKSMIVC